MALLDPTQNRHKTHTHTPRLRHSHTHTRTLSSLPPSPASVASYRTHKFFIQEEEWVGSSKELWMCVSVSDCKCVYGCVSVCVCVSESIPLVVCLLFCVSVCVCVSVWLYVCVSLWVSREGGWDLQNASTSIYVY